MSEEKKAQITGQPILVYPQQINQEDEINLIDIARTLIKRKKIILYTLLFFLLAGLIQYFLTVDRYNYSTTVRLAQIDAKMNTPLEDVNQIKLRLDNEYIPVVIADYAISDKGLNISGITSSLNKKSNLLILSTQSKIDNQNISSLHQQVLQLLINSQLPLLKKTKKNLAREISYIDNKLSLLTDKNHKSTAEITLNNQLRQLQSKIKALQNDFLLANKKLEKNTLSNELKKACSER